MADSDFTQSNEFFDQDDNHTYELFTLLRLLPQDLLTASLSDAQIQLVHSAFLHGREVQQVLSEGIDAIGDVFSNLADEKFIHAEGEPNFYFSRGTLSRLGRLLRHLAAENFCLSQLMENLQVR